MFSILQSVAVTNPEHPRFKQAGAVWVLNPAMPDAVAVRFDTDSAVEAVEVADLRSL